jgi:hypothetical protein
MRLRRLSMGLAVYLAIGVGHQSMAQDIKITDYDVPVSQSHQLYVTGDMQSRNIGIPYEYQQGRFNLGASLTSFYNSPYFAWQVQSSSKFDWRYKSGRPTRFTEAAQATVSVRRYVNGQGLFFGGVNLKTNWYHDNLRPGINLGGSVGLGRTVEATVLARAIRISEFLIKEGILNRHLSKETLLALAAIINREGEYKMRYGDKYMVWWLADMDQLIAVAASLPEGSVGPIGIFRIREVLHQEQIQRRVHGWTVETGISKQVARGSSSMLEDPDIFAAATVTRPLGLKHQLLAETRMSTKTGEMFGERYQFTVSLKHVFELSNRIDIALTEYYIKQHNQRNDYDPAYELGVNVNRVSLAAYYYLENAVSVNFAGTLEHRYSWITWPQYQETSQRVWGINLSVGYHVF